MKISAQKNRSKADSERVQESKSKREDGMMRNLFSLILTIIAERRSRFEKECNEYIEFWTEKLNPQNEGKEKE